MNVEQGLPYTDDVTLWPIMCPNITILSGLFWCVSTYEGVCYHLSQTSLLCV